MVRSDGSFHGKTALALLSRYADPTVLLRSRPARLVAFPGRHSHGALGEQKAVALIAATRTSIDPWGPGGIDLGELAADIAAEAQQAQALSEQSTTWTSGSATPTPRPIPNGSPFLRPVSTSFWPV